MTLRMLSIEDAIHDHHVAKRIFVAYLVYKKIILNELIKTVALYNPYKSMELIDNELE